MSSSSCSPRNLSDSSPSSLDTAIIRLAEIRERQCSGYSSSQTERFSEFSELLERHSTREICECFRGRADRSQRISDYLRALLAVMHTATPTNLVLFRELQVAIFDALIPLI